MFIYLWQTWQTCIKTKICEHAFRSILYRERERGSSNPSELWAYGQQFVHGTESKLMLTYLSCPRCPRWKRGQLDVDQWHTQSGRQLLIFTKGTFFSGGWHDEQLMQTCWGNFVHRKKKKQHQVCSYWVLIPWQFQDVGPHYVYTSIYVAICVDMQRVCDHSIGDSGSWTDHLIWMLLVFLGAGCAIQYPILAISYPLVICYIANWKITMLLMGKSTINGHFQLVL